MAQDSDVNIHPAPEVARGMPFNQEIWPDLVQP